MNTLTAFERADVQLFEFAQPFDSIDQIAAYICSPENDSMMLWCWREVIRAWFEGKSGIYTVHNWRATGQALRDCDEIPADWDSLHKTHVELAQDVFLACLERLTL
jgi:hypothetical protein